MHTKLTGSHHDTLIIRRGTGEHPEESREAVSMRHSAADLLPGVQSRAAHAQTTAPHHSQRPQGE